MARPVVYIKLPVTRNNFVDPPDLNWSEEKEEQLWKIISKSKKTEVDWSKLSAHFQVPVAFLQRQAFWLYEVELEQLRKKIQKSHLSSDTINETNVGSIDTVMSRKADMKKMEIFESPAVSQVLDPASNKHGTSLNIGVRLPQSDLDSAEEESYDDDSDSSKENTSGGSALLYRSRIFTKPLTKYKKDEEDVDESDDDDYERIALSKSDLNNLRRKIDANQGHHRRESSGLNISGSITKSALEEALLSNSHF